MRKKKPNKSKKIQRIDRLRKTHIKNAKQINSSTSQKKGRIIFFLKKVKNWILFVFGISGFLFSLYIFYPRISIESPSLLDPYRPFIYPFVVKNDGNIKIINFHYDITLGEIVTESNKYIDFNFPQSDSISSIKVNGSHTLNLRIPINSGITTKDSSGNLIKVSVPIQRLKNKIQNAQVFIVYNYSIPIFKFHFRGEIKFVLHRDYQNKYFWKEYQY